MVGSHSGFVIPHGKVDVLLGHLAIRLFLGNGSTELSSKQVKKAVHSAVERLTYIGNGEQSVT